MKLNNKGFAISTIMYMIMILAVLLITLTLALLSGRKLILDKLKVEVQNNIYNKYDLTYRETLNALKEEAINYAYTKVINKVSIKISDLNSDVDSEILDGYNLSNKYLTVNYNNGTYDTYLGKEKTITDISKPINNMLDIVDYKIEGNTYQETTTQSNNLCPPLTNDRWEFLNGAFINEDGYLELPNENSSATVTIDWNKRGEILFVKATIPNGGNYHIATTYYDENGTNLGGNGSAALDLEENASAIGYFGTVSPYSEYLANAKTVEVSFIRSSNYAVNNYTVKNIMVSTKSISYEEFVPNSPSVEYPSEIKSVGDNTNNLLPGDNLISNGFVLQEDGSYYLENSSVTHNKVLFKNTQGISGSLTFSFYIKFVLYNRYCGTFPVIYYTDGSYYSLGNLNEIGYDRPTDYVKIKYTTPSNKEVDYITWAYETGGAQTYIKDMQLEKGIGEAKYDSYGYIKIPVKVSGKNLFNINDTTKVYGGFNYGIVDNVITLTANATYGAQYMSNYVTNLDSSKNYTFSYKGKKLVKGTAGSPRVYILIEGSNDGENYKLITYLHEINPVEGQEYSFSRTLTGYSNYKFSLYNNTSTPVTIGEKTQYYDIQLEEGNKATEYEPYLGATTNIYLDEPLRKIENNVDSIVYKEQKLIKNTNSITLTGLENEWTRWQESITDKTIGVFYSNNDVLGVYQNPKFKLNVGFSNYFKIKNEAVHTQNDSVVGSARLAATSSPPYFGFKVPYTNLSNWLSHLQRINSEGNPLIVEYVLNETKNISTTLPHINTEIGANKISIDTEIEPSNVEFTIIEKIKQF